MNSWFKKKRTVLGKKRLQKEFAPDYGKFLQYLIVLILGSVWFEKE